MAKAVLNGQVVFTRKGNNVMVRVGHIKAVRL
jgi:hypothetical protein